MNPFFVDRTAERCDALVAETRYRLAVSRQSNTYAVRRDQPVAIPQCNDDATATKPIN